MITNIKLENFKIHKEVDVELSNLTIETGINGMGKSSIIQSLLLLRQSYLKDNTLNGLHLNGDLLKINSKDDLLCEDFEGDNISFGLQSTEGDLQIESPINGSSNTADYLNASNVSPSIDYQQSGLFSNNFHYIGANRLTPRDLYEQDTDQVVNKKQLSKKYGDCALTVHFLHHWGDKIECIDPLLFPEGDDNSNADNVNWGNSISLEGNVNRENKKLLKYQVDKWLQTIAPDIKVVITQYVTDFKLNYKFDKGNGETTKPYSAVNVGFGITYTLPILVAILSSKPGALILIENPEAHLHPGAISALMDLICKAVKAGIQIIIETHSDHVINGMLVKVAQENRAQKRGEQINGPLVKDLTKVFFFTRNNENHTSVVKDLLILEDGHIVEKELENKQYEPVPEGFFTQIEHDTEDILGLYDNPIEESGFHFSVESQFD